MASSHYLVELSAGSLATVQSSINSLLLDGVQLRGFDFAAGGTLTLGTPGFTLGGAAGGVFSCDFYW